MHKELQELFSTLQSIIYDENLLKKFIMRQAKNILTKWSIQGCERSQVLLNYTHSYDEFQEKLSEIEGYQRTCNNSISLQIDPSKCISTIRTSGSSGFPLTYGISQEWRLLHNLVWKIAYQKMTDGDLKGYLDHNYVWAMARAPGMSSDNLSNLIECIPSRFGIQFHNLKNNPSVIHGSSTTMLEMLEYSFVQRWRPKYIIFTYEKPSDHHIECIREAWPNAKIHFEYASNDGGASAFTCSHGKLHFWTIRSIPSHRSGNLRVTDLWNTATNFVGYECGDLVEWEDHDCDCGLKFPTLTVQGRKAGSITLENGTKISQLCPFNSEQMEGIKALKVYVHPNNKALIKVVPQENKLPNSDFLNLCQHLQEMGFETTELAVCHSIAELREAPTKFKVVVDMRR